MSSLWAEIAPYSSENQLADGCAHPPYITGVVHAATSIELTLRKDEYEAVCDAAHMISCTRRVMRAISSGRAHVLHDHERQHEIINLRYVVASFCGATLLPLLPGELLDSLLCVTWHAHLMRQATTLEEVTVQVTGTDWTSNATAQLDMTASPSWLSSVNASASTSRAHP